MLDDSSRCGPLHGPHDWYSPQRIALRQRVNAGLLSPSSRFSNAISRSGRRKELILAGHPQEPDPRLDHFQSSTSDAADDRQMDGSPTRPSGPDGNRAWNNTGA